jgi:hypothetical protein
LTPQAREQGRIAATRQFLSHELDRSRYNR